MLKTLMRTMLWVLLALAGIFLLLAAAVKAINWQDAAPSPAALAYAWPAPDAAELSADPSDNGFLVLAGLDASMEKAASNSAIAAAELGRRRLQIELERYRGYLKHGDADTEWPATEAAGLSDEDILPSGQRCRDLSQDCMSWLACQGQAFGALAPAQAMALERFDAIRQAAVYQANTPPYVLSKVPPYPIVMAAHDLALIEAGLALQQGDAGGALDHLAELSQVAQRVAGKPESLIAGMVAVAMMHDELHWMSSMLRHAPGLCVPPHAKRLRRQIRQQSVQLAPALHAEGQMMMPTFQSLGVRKAFRHDKGDLKGKLVSVAALLDYQPQRSINALAEVLDEVVALSKLPASELDAARAAAHSRIEAQKQARKAWGGLRNALGELLLTLAEPLGQVKYIERAHDLEGHRRLVLLQLAACEQAVADDDMPAWLTQSPDELRDPYTRQPMGWDTESRSWFFEGRQPQNRNPEKSPVYRVKR